MFCSPPGGSLSWSSSYQLVRSGHQISRSRISSIKSKLDRNETILCETILVSPVPASSGSSVTVQASFAPQRRLAPDYRGPARVRRHTRQLEVPESPCQSLTLQPHRPLRPGLVVQ